MIKYLELTAPEASAFRQAKILSVECEEGQSVKEGDTLFLVRSGESEIPLPSTKDGKVVEIIATEDENITISTPLILIETIVEKSTASKPITSIDEVETIEANDPIEELNQPMEGFGNSSINHDRDQEEGIEARLEPLDAIVNGHEQQSLDLMLDSSEDANKKPQLDNQEAKNMGDASQVDVTVPDIGADSAKVIEILVQVGDSISEDDPLLTLESDKASMDVPSPASGTIKSIDVSIDQDVSEGTLIVTLEAVGTQSTPAVDNDVAVQNGNAGSIEEIQPESKKESNLSPSSSGPIEVSVPDIGGDSAKVIEILVAIGERVSEEDSLVTLESDKASMDVPSSHAGVVEAIHISIDDDVSEGNLIVTLSGAMSEASASPANTEQDTQKKTDTKVAETPSTNTAAPAPQPIVATSNTKSHATPSVRRFARELGVDLSKVNGSGRKGRILADDVKLYVKGVVSGAGSSNNDGGTGIPPIPAQDFSKFGAIERVELNKIKRLTATNLHRSWLNVPMVTHHDEANITSLESFRKQVNADYKSRGEAIKLSPLAFIVKALVRAMRTYPQFNSSLDPSGEALIYKKYFNIGIAVDTPNGLVVPVIKDADKKSVSEIAQEMGDLAARAREKKLKPTDMSGACMTISSLGGIGGTSFTPLVNAPEVAILGVSRSKMAPLWNGEAFDPALMLPLSLTYDHRVIDGAEAARFARLVAEVLEDVRLLTV